MNNFYRSLSGEARAKADVLIQENDKLIALGYWCGPHADPDLPHPEKFVDQQWNTEERRLVIDYLRRQNRAVSYLGVSYCRFGCGEMNMGTCDMSDGVYVWPEGLIHYLEKHFVRLPEEFVDHIRRNIHAKPIEPCDEKIASLIALAHVSYSWWKSQKGY